MIPPSRSFAAIYDNRNADNASGIDEVTATLAVFKQIKNFA
jgi:hypothetical protein